MAKSDKQTQNRQHPQTTIEDNYTEKPASAWDFLNPESYETTSIIVDELESPFIRIHGVELYEGIDDKEFAVMEVSYIFQSEEEKETLNNQRFSLRSGAKALVKLSRDIHAARAARVKLPPVPVEIYKKGRAVMIAKTEETSFGTPPPEETQQEIPF